MLEKIEGKRRKGQQKMGWLDGITDLIGAGVQPWWIQGDSKVGTESASLEKYIFNHRYREIRNG